jgi:drug/metabolite transporter (DMT)-like permease
VISFALGPVSVVLFGATLRPGSKAVRGEMIAAVGIVALLCVLAFASISGRSAVGAISVPRAVVGLALAIVSGVASTGNIIWSRRLSDAGLRPRSILLVRFFLMIVVSWVLAFTLGPPTLAAAVSPGAVLAVFSVALPTYLLQVGIAHTEPATQRRWPTCATCPRCLTTPTLGACSTSPSRSGC